MSVIGLPVAKTDVYLRSPAGADEILLLEAPRLDFGVAIVLLARLARTADDKPIDGPALAVCDVDALLLRLRQEIIGDMLRTDTVCAATGCSRRVDIAFSIEAYLQHHEPSVPAGVVPAAEPGWHRLDADSQVEFRPPRAADQLAIAIDADPFEALWGRCVRGGARTNELRQRVEDVMESMAPSLYGELSGTCSECGADVVLEFDPLAHVLGELRGRAAYLYQDVALIAHHYHWSEAEILDLPAARRTRYAELAAEHGRGRDWH